MENKDTSFYGFYLYTTDDIGYLSIGAFINAKDDSAWKWSPCDATLHGKYGFLEKSEATIWWVLKDHVVELDDGEYEQITSLHKIRLLNVMKRLDKEVFSEKQERESYVLNVLIGDQTDEERVAFANELNPKNIAQRYEKELNEMYS